jgi:hypothetical protein
MAGTPPLRAQVSSGVSGSGFFVTSLINGGALGDAIIVTLPDDVGVEREGEQTLDSFSVK